MRMLVTNAVVFSLHNKRFPAFDKICVIPGNESDKGILRVENLYKVLISYKMSKTDTLIGVGGGALLDLVGFVAATYKRGMKLEFIPTTLLAMIDASVGGKNGVNIDGIKNVVGTIYEPDKVQIDIKYLSTLPDEQWKSGIGELIKYSILDEDFFDLLSRAPIKMHAFSIIRHCISIKKKIIDKDLHDERERQLLNLGHTVGHAIETVIGVTHGDAVVKGIQVATDISLKRNILTRGESEKIYNLCNRHGFALHLPMERIPDIIEKIKQDKKILNDKLNFILPIKIGEVRIFDDVTLEEIRSVL